MYSIWRLHVLINHSLMCEVLLAIAGINVLEKGSEKGLRATINGDMTMRVIRN